MRPKDQVKSNKGVELKTWKSIKVDERGKRGEPKSDETGDTGELKVKLALLVFAFYLTTNCILHCCFRFIMSVNLKPNNVAFVLIDYVLE